MLINKNHMQQFFITPLRGRFLKVVSCVYCMPENQGQGDQLAGHNLLTVSLDVYFLSEQGCINIKILNTFWDGGWEGGTVFLAA